MLVDATQNVWEKRWFVLRRCVKLQSYMSFGHHAKIHYRPYLNMYKHSNELEELGIASLTGVNVESNPEMEAILCVRSPSPPTPSLY